jgi:hypothetical protein
MHLKLKELANVAKKTITEEKITNALRKEVARVLGPSVLTDVRLERMAECANDRIDVLERTRRADDFDFRPSIVSKFMNNPSAEVRRFVARVLPEQYVARMWHDHDLSVRHAVARRLPLTKVQEMVSRDPGDDELRVIMRNKRIQEAGITLPKVEDEPFDMYGEDRLGDAVKQGEEPEMSDQYYATLAHRLISDYSGNMEGQWEEIVAHRYCVSVKMTSGVEIDEKKLYDEIIKQLTEKDDRTLERYALKETVELLREGVEPEIFVEDVDPVQELLSSQCSAAEYVAKANEVFHVREAAIPNSLRKYRVTEGCTGDFMVPVLAVVPGTRTISTLDEQALDRYVRSWNDKQAGHGEPIRIDWAPNPCNVGTISFKAELK